MMLIATSGVVLRYTRKPSPEHRHQPAHHLNGKVPNVGLHHALRSYLVHGALMEQELFGRMKRIWIAYLKLQGDLDARQANVGGDLEEALKELSTKEDELGNWQREMEVWEQMIEGLKASMPKNPLRSIGSNVSSKRATRSQYIYSNRSCKDSRIKTML
ncbi:uncharacterized protein A4U43_C06F10070 [Asparagus officinalis]|uniref:Uncharacterized protein n=1 Tax=Asparagus officinalis TaxID=4686 RepID=A0A5P1ELS4_ASPOF|nr:uncharacterized protein A4U43_C06F10070 [Asparagus officinalis]